MESRVIILLILSLIVSSCKIHLKEIRSTRQMWCVLQNNLYGINYHFTFKTYSDFTQLKFDSIKLHDIWIKDFHYSVIGKSNTERKFLKGDTILISVNKLDTIVNDNIFIHFSVKDKLKTVSISKIKNLEKLCP